MRVRDGLHYRWAWYKHNRRVRGLPTIDLSHGADTTLVPSAEAMARGAYFQEAATPSDFPNALGNTLYRELVTWAGQLAVQETWRQYFRIAENMDFRIANKILASEFEDLLPVPTGAEYKDSTATDAYFQIGVQVYGRLFGVSRETIINDDIGFLRDIPSRLARATSRSQTKYMVRSTLEQGTVINGYNGAPVFSAANGNFVTGASTALQSSSLQTGIYTMQTNVGDPALNPSGGPIGVAPRILLVPPALEFTAFSLINSALIVAAGTAGTVTTQGNINPLQNILVPIVDRWLTSTTRWWIFADPAEAPAFAAAFLVGRPNPDLLLERPYMTSVMGGGDDPYEVEVDRVVYKARHQWGSAGGVYWGAYCSQGF